MFQPAEVKNRIKAFFNNVGRSTPLARQTTCGNRDGISAELKEKALVYMNHGDGDAGEEGLV